MSELVTTLKEFMVIFQTLGPWGIVFFIWWDGKKESKKWEERHQSVVRMYENNIDLVRGYHKLANNQQDLIIMNTTAISELSTILKDRRAVIRPGGLNESS